MTYSQDFIDKHRDINVHHDWWDAVYEHFDRACEILGIDLDKGEPSFSGFWSQGDGASWTGRYRACAMEPKTYALVPTYDLAPAQIREYAPQDETLHTIADELCILGRIYCPAYCSVTRGGHTRYVHESTMSVGDVEPYYGFSEFADEVITALEEGLLVQFRALAGWLYATLEAEHDYLTSDEAVIETLEANEIEEEKVE